MTEFDYPPTRDVSLGTALDQATERIADLDADDDADGVAKQRWQNQRDALAWAVDEFGADATVVLTAYTARTRSRVLDTIQTEMKGQVGPEETSVWLAAAGVDDAPWLDDKDITSKATVMGQLPPALVDWVNRQLDDLNDLSEGNY